MAARETPKCVALIVCNDVIEDKRTNNKTLVGIFNAIGSSGVPCTHDRMVVFASLSDGVGVWGIELRLFAPSGDELLRVGGEITFPDPHTVEDLVFELRGVQLPDAGTYFAVLFADGGPVGERRFDVRVDGVG
jgi:hypothetical protein